MAGLSSSLTKAQPLLDDQSDDYTSAIQDLKASLDARKNQLFDPVLLALAQGFAAPTKSGGFGESLGTAAGLASQAAQAQQKGDLENAQMRMQLAQMEMDQRRKAKAQQMVGELLPKPVGASPSGAASSGATEVSTTAGTPPVSEMRPITGADIFKITQYDKELGDALSKAVQVDRDRFKIAQNGIVFDSGMGQYLNVPIPGQTQSKYDTPFGSFNMTPNEYAQLGQAISQGKGKEWITMWRQGKIDVTGKPIAGATAGATDTAGRPTTSEAEAAAAAKKAEAEGGAKTRVEQTREVKDASKAAMTLIPLYDRADKLLKTKGIETALGVFENPDFLSQIGTIVDEGIRVGPYAINAPSMRKIATNFATDQNVINALTELGQVEAMWQFAQRKGLGSGTSVSNMEQQLVNAMGPNFKDPKDAYTKKLQFMREKANFEQTLGKELRRTGMQYEDYADTEDFDRLFADYRNRLERIGEVKVPRLGGPINPSAGSNLRKQAGIP